MSYPETTRKSATVAPVQTRKWSRKRLLWTTAIVNIVGIATGLLPGPDALLSLCDVVPGLSRAGIPVTAVSVGTFATTHYHMKAVVTPRQIARLAKEYDLIRERDWEVNYGTSHTIVQDRMEYADSRVYQQFLQEFKRSLGVELYSGAENMGFLTDHVRMHLYYNKSTREMLLILHYDYVGQLG